ncbi:hypothetical protein N9P07_01245 [Alphaproteobacteria bacterium]|jgi:hypothetical protein|nr:hypothetical protein [Alphaproteobacteria bacterium]
MRLFDKQKLTQDTKDTLSAILLHDLIAEKLDIFCWCNKCNHNNIIATKLVMEKLGPNYPVPEVGRNLRCGKCNNTQNIATRPNWPTHGGQIARHM